MSLEQKEDGFAVIGLSQMVRNEDPSAIGRLWEAFRSNDLRALLGPHASREIYCVYHDYEGGVMDPYRMTIGYRMPSATPVEGLHCADIPSQWMVSYAARGPQPQSVIAQWQKIWNSSLNRAYCADYDVYGADDAETVYIKVGVRRT